MNQSAIPTAPTFQFKDDVARNFIDTQLPLVNAQFGCFRAPFDLALDAYVPKAGAPGVGTSVAIDDKLTWQEHSFKDAVHSSLRSKKGKVHFDLTKHFRWTEVLQEVHIAQIEYHGSGDKSIVRSMREKLKSFGDYAGTVEGWLRLLPSESWQGSLVCGGIKLVLTAARQLGEMRNDICEAIETVPEMIANTKALEHLYSDAKTLRSHASQLYVAILEVLELSLSWYDRHPIRKAAKALLRGDDYTIQLKQAVNNLKSLEIRIDKQASINGQFLLAHTARDVAEVLNHMKSFATEKKANFQWQSEIDCLKAEMFERDQRYPSQQQAFNRERKYLMLRLLRANPSLASEDLSIMFSADAATFDDAQDRIAYLMTAGETAQWLASPSSATLIVNGSEKVDSLESATSLFSAMLVRSLQNFGGSLVLYWFCGQHLHDPVQRMLHNLLSQLLDSLSLGADLPETSVAGSPDNVEDLTGLLRACLQEELRYRPVFCILDAVSWYEDRYRSRDLCRIFNKIAALTTAMHQENYPLKLLVASPTRSFDISRTRQAMSAMMLDAPDEVDGVADDLDEVDMLQHTRYCLSRPAVRSTPRMSAREQ